jgi:hypothetical protein
VNGDTTFKCTFLLWQQLTSVCGEGSARVLLFHTSSDHRTAVRQSVGKTHRAGSTSSRIRRTCS